jgi:uncharacterized protein YndB with AHSA1/START domain
MTIIYILIAIFAIFFVIISTQPSDFKLTRSATMAAQPATIFPHVNNLHNWNEWSPWAKIDPNARNSFEGTAEGIGSIMRWDSDNNKVGKGSMTITESRPNEYIKFRMDFLKPMVATSTAEFAFKPEGDQTIVTWSMSGNNNFMGKTIHLLMNCDKMVGGQFEKGLNDLKKIVENK